MPYLKENPMPTVVSANVQPFFSFVFGFFEQHVTTHYSFLSSCLFSTYNFQDNVHPIHIHV